MNEYELVNEFEKRGISLAPFPKRFLAYIIDDLIIGVFVYFIFSNQIAALSSAVEVAANIDEVLDAYSLLFAITLPYIIFLKIIVQTLFVYLYGATPGKMLMKIRVIYIDTISNPKLFISLVRASARVISEQLLYIGFIWAYFNPKRQTWQDLIAKTLVINA